MRDERKNSSRRSGGRGNGGGGGDSVISGSVGGANSIGGGGGTSSSRSSRQHSSSDPHNAVERVSNKVQAQIERMFTDVAKDATSCSFPVRCLGSLPLKDKVTSLSGLQEPLRQLYLSGAGHGVSEYYVIRRLHFLI